MALIEVKTNTVQAKVSSLVTKVKMVFRVEKAF